MPKGDPILTDHLDSYARTCTHAQVLNGFQAKVTAGVATALEARRMDGALLAVGIMADLLKHKVGV